MLELDNKKTYLIFGAIIMLVFFHYLGWLKLIENPIKTTLSPVSSAFYGLNNKISTKYDTYKKRKELENLYQQCQINYAKIKVLQTKITKLEEENKKIKKLADFKGTSKYKMIAAQVIGRSSNTTEKTIMIDAGKEQNIINDLAVVVQDGVLIGKISKVDKKTSMIRLINDNQSKIAGIINNKEKSMGVIEGGFGLSVRMKLIPRDDIVMVKDKVTTSGLNKNIPKGLLIGEVAVSEKESFQPFQQAILTPTVNLEKITLVSIILPD